MREDDRRVRDAYADILGPDPDAGLVRVAGALDSALSSAYAAGEAPRGVVEAVEREAAAQSRLRGVPESAREGDSGAVLPCDARTAGSRRRAGFWIGHGAFALVVAATTLVLSAMLSGLPWDGGPAGGTDAGVNDGQSLVGAAASRVRRLLPGADSDPFKGPAEGGYSQDPDSPDHEIARVALAFLDSRQMAIRARGDEAAGYERAARSLMTPAFSRRERDLGRLDIPSAATAGNCGTRDVAGGRAWIDCGWAVRNDWEGTSPKLWRRFSLVLVEGRWMVSGVEPTGSDRPTAREFDSWLQGDGMPDTNLPAPGPGEALGPGVPASTPPWD